MARKRAISEDRVFIEARPDLGGAIVKSAQRVLEVFELFSDIRAGVTVADVASKLNMPQSSTSALLRSLHTLGYLTIDSDDRTYLPTGRVALLGHWIEPRLVTEGPVLKMAREVTDQIGLDTFLATRNKLHVQIVYRQYGPNPKSHGPTGSGSFLALAATGHVLMSDMAERDVTKLVVATNPQLGPDETPVSPRELIARLADVRMKGYAVGPSRRSHDHLTVAVRLPDIMTEPMAFGVSVPAKDIVNDPERWARLMMEAVKKWLGED
jgi:DNA-binding IclR family transcriptional regulator